MEWEFYYNHFRDAEIQVILMLSAGWMGRRQWCLGASVLGMGWKSFIIGDARLLLSCCCVLHVTSLPDSSLCRRHESKVPLLFLVYSWSLVIQNYASILEANNRCFTLSFPEEAFKITLALIFYKPWCVSFCHSPIASFCFCSCFFPYKLKLELYSSNGGRKSFLTHAQEVT